ncbi:hypothetical protein [Streptomyces sp. B1I3]|uniref:hypothetical protein n=1 Tax=Streptomyces sp. B1I3 TaxID=3042264 RepID=UPI00278A4BC5|nr:hypothetical protein [Streptomyces sp. B1I3]MDQ0793839.1 hypothetical protein [Streptomyces sp. B1I3]
MSNSVRTYAPRPVTTHARPEPDPRWWVLPLAGTALAPVLAVVVTRADHLFAGRPFLLAGCLVLAYALIAPSWFLPRTADRRRRRGDLVLAGCACAAGFPSLITALGWVVFFVMLCTGNVSG